MALPRNHAALVLCVGFLLGLSARADGNLLVNGSFELPGDCAGNCVTAGGSTAIAGWTTVLSGVEHVDPNAFGTGPVPAGRRAVDLANHVYPQGGGVSQSFDTSVGGRYLLSFWAGNALFDGRIGSGTVQVQVAGLHLLFDTPQANSLQGVWESYEVKFQALGARTELVFFNTQDPLLHYALIDDVRVIEVPEPPVLLLLMSGLLLLARHKLRRR